MVNRGSQEVRVYAPDGVFLHAFGSQGGGPGEFENPRLLGRLGPDSLFVYDATHRRVSVVHVDDGFVRSFPTPSQAGGYPVGQGLFSDGTQV